MVEMLLQMNLVLTTSDRKPTSTPRHRRLLGLQFKPSLAMSSPLNLPAPGRCQAVYFIFLFRTAMCFC